MKDSYTLPSDKELKKTRTLVQTDHDQLLKGSRTEIHYPIDMTVIDLIEKQVKNTPDAVAVIFEEQQLTYRELNERANKLAHYLKSKGLKEETLIPIFIERSLQMIIGIIGVLKASCAYVPIDIDYPEERIRYILEDTGATAVISSEESGSKLEAFKYIDIIKLDSAVSLLKNYPVTNQQIPAKANQLAYVIYTSGSTGMPKGVMIEHAGLANLSINQAEGFQLKPGTRTLQFASFGFDASCSEIFTALTSGGGLVLTKKRDLLSAEEFENLIKKHRIEVVTLPPSYQHVIKDNLGTLKTIISAGEPLNEALGTYLQSKGIRLMNAYGPTENTVCVSMTDNPIKENHVVSIGKPISNVEVYILDEKGSVCPPGVAGEICVSGVQVARGYLNRPDLTAEKFVENPFTEIKGMRMYKTGDLGRWLNDGDIEFLGRIDEQVKIRGYRIELGEVETVLNQNELVKQAVVIAKEDKEGGKLLVAYIEVKDLFDKKAITAYLKSKLPEYMVPTILINLEKFPVTSSGKIDKKNLPEPFVKKSSDEYVAPKTQVQQKLADIWKELLNIQQIGLKDNFFDLGGDSIKAVEIIGLANREGYNLKPSDFFTNQTIEELANVIEKRVNLNKPKQEHTNGEKKWVVPMNDAEKRIPFFFMSPGFSVYDKVISALDKDQPFYLFIPYAYKSVEEIASHYIQEMKRVQPKGPYCLGGYCDFGEVALEMAQQLKAEGEEVNFLALFEFYYPSTIKPFNLKERVDYYSNELKKLSVAKKGLLFAELIIKHINRFRRRTARAIDTKIRKDIERIRNLQHEPGYLIGKGLYTAKPYSGKVLLFKSSIQTLRIDESPLMGWSDYFNNVELVTIEGNHKTMFHNRGSVQIAEKLNAHAVFKE